MSSTLKGLGAGLILGIAATLLVVHLTGPEKSVPERLEEALHWTTGRSTRRRRSPTTPPATRFGPRRMPTGCSESDATPARRRSTCALARNRSTLEHALATMRRYGPVCVVEPGLFGGRQLGGNLLDELCDEVGGEVRDL